VAIITSRGIRNADARNLSLFPSFARLRSRASPIEPGGRGHGHSRACGNPEQPRPARSAGHLRRRSVANTAFGAKPFAYFWATAKSRPLAAGEWKLCTRDKQSARRTPSGSFAFDKFGRSPQVSGSSALRRGSVGSPRLRNDKPAETRAGETKNKIKSEAVRPCRDSSRSTADRTRVRAPCPRRGRRSGK